MKRWSGKEVCYLRAAYQLGEPVTMIAGYLGRTRNSVLGMAQYLKLKHALPRGLSNVPMHIRKLMAAE